MKRQGTRFEDFNHETLDQTIHDIFYMEVSTESGDKYKETTLTIRRNDFNRYLSKKRDILKDKKFTQSNTTFTAVLAYLKREVLRRKSTEISQKLDPVEHTNVSHYIVTYFYI